MERPDALYPQTSLTGRDTVATAPDPGSGALTLRRSSRPRVSAPGVSVRTSDQLIGMLWSLLDIHSDRSTPTQMRAMYAASEAYMSAEVAVTQSARLRGWVWVSRVLPAVLRLVWLAGQMRGRIDALGNVSETDRK